MTSMLASDWSWTSTVSVITDQSWPEPLRLKALANSAMPNNVMQAVMAHEHPLGGLCGFLPTVTLLSSPGPNPGPNRLQSQMKVK